jgi:hypothetical protein
MTVERVDNDRGYSPDNCIWADRKVQFLNKRSHGRNKLTAAQALAIRNDPRRPYRTIAADYGITRHMVGMIIRGNVWKDNYELDHRYQAAASLRGNQKLTPDQVRAIRVDPRHPYSIIAADYRVSYSTIKYIKSGRSWKDA